MRNLSLARSSGRSAVLCVTAQAVFFVFLLLLGFPLHATAQDFIPEKFDKALLEESLQEQAILREEMLFEQAILREEMEQIRLEIQRIMREISLSMKGEALKLKAELEGLKGETRRIQEEIMAALEKSKQDFLDGKEEMQRELKNMQQEAKVLTKEIKQVLDDQKAVWKQETAALQGTLVEARKEMDSAKVDSEEVLRSSRSAIIDFQKAKVVTMTASRSESNAAMLDAGHTFKKSQSDYKQDSASITKELMADIKKTQKNMKRRQKAQQKNSKNSKQEVLASLKKAKKQRLAELKRDSTRKKVRKKKVAQPRKKKIRKKQTRKKKQIKKFESRQTLLARAKIKATDRRKAKEKVVKKLDKEDSQDKQTETIVVSDAVAKTSEEILQKEVTRLSTNITNLKKDLKKASNNPGILLAKLGDAYLEAQRFMSSQKGDEERQKLLDLSDTQDLLLGSYEQAAWAYKLSLNFTKKSAETHLKIGKIYDEMADGQNALMHAKLAHQIFKRRDKSSLMKEAQAFIEMLTTKYENESVKKTVRRS